MAHEQPRAQSVNQYSYARRPRNRRAVNGSGIGEFMNALHHNCSHGNEQNYCIEQGYEHAAFLISVCVSLFSRDFGKFKGKESQQKAEHIAQIVSRIRHKPQRIAAEANAGFHNHEKHVQGYCENINAVERREFLRMVMMMFHIKYVYSSTRRLEICMSKYFSTP